MPDRFEHYLCAGGVGDLYRQAMLLLQNSPLSCIQSMFSSLLSTSPPLQLLGLEERLVLLLCLDESLLETVGVCSVSVDGTIISAIIYSLSLLAKRMARV